MTTSPTTAKAVAAIMVSSFHMIAFATNGPTRGSARRVGKPEEGRHAGQEAPADLHRC
jgi:hypothetical protein